MAQILQRQVSGAALLKAGGGEIALPFGCLDRLRAGLDGEDRLAVPAHHNAQGLVPADLIPGGLGNAPDGGHHALVRPLAGELGNPLVPLRVKAAVDRDAHVVHGGEGGNIALVHAGEELDLLRRAVFVLPDQRPVAGVQVLHPHHLAGQPGGVDGLVRHLQRFAAGKREGGVVLIAGGGRHGPPGDFTKLRRGGAGGNIAHNHQGGHLGRQAQRHGGACPDIEGVPLLHLLQIQGQARGPVHRRSVAGVDDHFIQMAVLVVVFEVNALPLPGGDLAPDLDEGGELLGLFRRGGGLRRSGGDAQRGGQGRQGQQYGQ